MPVIWQSSQQPMYVRTVWVDGLRHAVLTTDDPYYKKTPARQRRPHTTTSYARLPLSRLSYQKENLEQCFRKLNFAIKHTAVESEASVYEDDIEKLDLSEIDQQSEENFVVKSKTLQLNEFESSRSRLAGHEMKTVRSHRTARTEVQQSTELSDRVLQWLDLAGKVDLLAPEPETARLAQPRHSWPAIQNRTIRKSRTVVDLKAKFEPKYDVKEGNIDRHDFHVPAPATTVETYARQSRHVRLPARDQTREPKTRAREVASGVAEARQRVACERRAVERHYAELVQQHLLPDYKTKKQVHIFMPPAPAPAPNAPRRQAASNISGITESLLSQLSKSTL